ncbi:MAG: primosomal protein N' [Acidiferrobacterales bacterium]
MPRAQKIIKVALPVPLRRVFDYLRPAEITEPDPGCRVSVPFGNRKLVGVAVGMADHSDLPGSKLKKITAVLESEPVLPDELLELLKWAATYYHHPLGEVVSTALPAALRAGKPAQIRQIERWRVSATAANADTEELKRAPLQRRVFDFIRDAENPVSRESLAELSANWRSAVNALAERGWLESVTTDDLLVPCGGGDNGPSLNDEQTSAVEQINSTNNEFKSFLLHGVTGSGKTEVYLGAVNFQLGRGKQVLMLVPEIGLTPQLVERVRRRVNAPVLLLHSALTDNERSNAWLQAAKGEPAVILGTRSAVFTPLPSLGLVIVDEEHDPSFKQQDGFRYHARDLAVMRANRNKVPIVLGSATPSLESMLNVRNGNYQLLRLSQRAGNAALPEVNLVDQRTHALNDGLSPPMIAAIKDRLAKSEQSLLFLNRRGYAPVIMCRACGWTQNCPRCDAHMIVHQHKKLLRCHHCGGETPLPERCPGCNAEELKPIGEGTERVENALKKLFPDARIDRVDRDTTARKGSLEQKLDDIREGRTDIIIGTQMLSKGHDFPNITLVGVLNADQGLYGADFRGPEHLIQQVMQVSGRAGRADRSGEVLIQTWHPDHAAFKALVSHDYDMFVNAALQERQQAGFPPYTYFALLRAEATERGRALQFLDKARKLGVPIAAKNKSLELFDALNAPMEKRAGRYRAQLLLKSMTRPALHNCLSAWLPLIEELPDARKVRWSLDVDPIDMY